MKLTKSVRTFSAQVSAMTAGGHLVALGVIFSATAASAAITVNGQSSTTLLNFAASVSQTDLANINQTTFDSSSKSASRPNFGGASVMSNGVYDHTTANNVFWYRDETSDPLDTFPATATINLNTTLYPLGFDITTINTFMGWAAVSQTQANQTYAVEVWRVGEAGYEPLTTVNYAPFAAEDSSGAYETFVSIGEDSIGVLASGVQSIRFTFADPGAGGVAPGTVLREIDILGVATVPEPGSASLLGMALALVGMRLRRPR